MVIYFVEMSNLQIDFFMIEENMEEIRIVDHTYSSTYPG